VKHILGSLLLSGACAAGAAGAQDSVHGKQVYWSCAYCHGIAGRNGPVGPPLVGVFGRQAGTVPGFPYSDAMKESGLIWDETALEFFVANPAQMFPGTRMVFPGLSDPKDAADLAAYIKKLK